MDKTLILSRLLTALALLALCALAAPGCGSDDGDAASDVTTSSGGADASSSSSGGDASSSSSGGGKTDASSGGECDDGTLVSIIQGDVVEEGGGPLENAFPQACVRLPNGQLLCLRPNPTDADGGFLQSVAFEAQCMSELTMRILLPDSTLSTNYCAIELPTEDTASLTFETPFILFPTTAATALPALGDEASARVVAFEDGLELDVTPDQFQFTTGGYDDLAVTPVAPDHEGVCFLDEGHSVAALYAFSPEANVLGDGFPVRFPNTTGLAPGAEVDLFVLGGLDCRDASDTTITEGEWFVFGTGTVSADGALIESAAGEGLPCLTWMGYAPKTP